MSAEAKSGEYGGWLRHDYGFVFGQKLTHKHRCVSCCVIMIRNLWLVFPQFCAFLTNCFVQSGPNFKLVFVIDRTTLWQELMMYHAIANEEKSKQNLHIWPNLACRSNVDKTAQLSKFFFFVKRSGNEGFIFLMFLLYIFEVAILKVIYDRAVQTFNFTLQVKGRMFLHIIL